MFEENTNILVGTRRCKTMLFNRILHWHSVQYTMSFRHSYDIHNVRFLTK